MEQEIQGRVVLAGGGEAQDSRLLDELFASWIGNGKLLYWPIALRGIRSFQSCREWIHATFGPLNVTSITMWTDLTQHQAGELEEFQAVYIGGGNTFSLAYELKASGFNNYLAAFVYRGGMVYGGSAGAVVLGRDIRTVRHIDRNDVGLVQMEGLDLANGLSIWVHYLPQDDKLIEAYVREHQQSVLAISERTGIAIEPAGMRTIGFEPAYRFDSLGKVEL